MLNGVYFDGALGQRGGALDSLDLVDISIDEGLVGNVDPAEFESVVYWGGFESEGDLLACVEGGSFKSGGFGQGVLRVGGHVGKRPEFRKPTPDKSVTNAVCGRMLSTCWTSVILV